MSLATPYTDKTDEQKAICEMVRQFADEQIIPNAEHYDAADEFPEPIVEQMRELGLFGVTIPEEYGGMGLDLTTYAMIVEELSRGWISISGIVNTHFIGSYLLMKFGTDEQKQKYLPKMATGEMRAAFSLSEPELGSDVAAIKASAKKLPDGDASRSVRTSTNTTPDISPLVTHIFDPLISQSSPSRVADVLIAATSEPNSGSLILNAARSSPVAIAGKNFSCCSLVPNFSNRYEPMKCVLTIPLIEIHPRESSSTIIA